MTSSRISGQESPTVGRDRRDDRSVIDFVFVSKKRQEMVMISRIIEKGRKRDA